MIAKNTKSMQDWIYEKVGERIRTARLNFTPKVRQEDLAAAVDMNRASIAKIESGSQRFTLDTLYLIAKRLDLEPAALLPKGSDFISALEEERSILESARAPEGLRHEELDSILRAIKKAKKT